jgi:hypothetical protein
MLFWGLTEDFMGQHKNEAKIKIQKEEGSEELGFSNLVLLPLNTKEGQIEANYQRFYVFTADWLASRLLSFSSNKTNSS